MAALLYRGLAEEGDAAEGGYTGRDAIDRIEVGWVEVGQTKDGRVEVSPAGVGQYDAVVLDVMLPDVDGFEVCRRLRASSIWVPVLMLTALDAVADRVAGL